VSTLRFSMNLVIWGWVAFSLVSAMEPALAEAPKSILFVGNSYTYQNNLPQLVLRLATAAKHRGVTVDTSVGGGMTLEQHHKKGKAKEKIGSRQWDVVVLQDQSQMPIFDPERTLQYAAALHQQIRDANAQCRTVYFMTWAREHLPDTQAQLAKVYRQAAAKTDAEVAPVGLAWQSARIALPEVQLHRTDKSHPTLAGSYLAACVFFATLFEESPVGLPAPKGLSNAAAKQLQQIAWQTVSRYEQPERGEGEAQPSGGAEDGSAAGLGSAG